MPNNRSGTPQPTPMPRDFTGGAEPVKIVRILDGNACYPDTYSDYEGQSFRSEYNAHEPEAQDDSLMEDYT